MEPEGFYQVVRVYIIGLDLLIIDGLYAFTGGSRTVRICLFYYMKFKWVFSKFLSSCT